MSAPLPPWAADLLDQAGLVPLGSVGRLSGGDHGELLRVATTEGDWVVKGHVRPGSMFLREAAGLRALAAAGVRVPEVRCSAASGLVMRHLAAGPRQPEALGRMIAALHRQRPTPDTYGWPESVFLGAFEFPAGTGTWQQVFRERRVEPLLRATWSQLGRLGPRLERWLQRAELPLEGACLVHGDLWAGNALATADGPALVDPGVQWAERGLDLAMMELFGGFGGRCRAAYEEVLPVSEELRRAIPAYQLVYLLVHVHFFGSSYLTGVAEALAAVE